MTPIHFILIGWLRKIVEKIRCVQLALSAERFPPISAPHLGLRKTRHIIVIGAGLAGLTCAHLLKQAGQVITVLEARSRPGGRVLTLREPFSRPLWADVGASRIADIHAWTLYWVKQFGLRLEPMYPHMGKLFRIEGGQLREGAQTTFLSSDEIHHLLTGDIPWNTEVSRCHQLLRSFKRTVVTPNWYRIRGGMDLLPRAFADQLGAQIQYGVAVTGIDSHKRHVSVSCHGMHAQFVEGDFAVCTIPYSVFSSIRMSPELSAEKTRLLREIKYQSAIRVLLEFDERSWLDRKWNGYGVTDDGMEVWRPSFNQQRPHHLLSVYAQGDATQPFIGLAPEDVIARTIDKLAGLFPRLQKHCIRAVALSWQQEPWSMGAQSLKDQAFMASLQQLQTPEDLVHFAGEHTSEGWMNGALQSGHRAAREILARIEA